MQTKTRKRSRGADNAAKPEKKAKALTISEYNHAYYMAHKGDKKFQERRRRNDRNRRKRITDADRRKRNEQLRRRWATDPLFRQRTSEYQKAWRKMRKEKAFAKSIKRKS